MNGLTIMITNTLKITNHNCTVLRQTTIVEPSLSSPYNSSRCGGKSSHHLAKALSRTQKMNDHMATLRTKKMNDHMATLRTKKDADADLSCRSTATGASESYRAREQALPFAECHFVSPRHTHIPRLQHQRPVDLHHAAQLKE